MVTRAWDETDPADTNDAAEGAQEIRELKVDVRERMSLEHAFGLLASSSDAGMHRWAYAHKTTSVTLALTDHFVRVASGVTLSLPDASTCKGKTYFVIMTEIGSATIQAATGQVITSLIGATWGQTFTLYGTAYGYDSVLIISDGSNWIMCSLRETNINAANISTLKGVAYSFPGTQGAAGTYLANDGSGNLTWSLVTLPTSALTSEGQIGYDDTNNRLRLYNADGEIPIPTISSITPATVLSLTDTRSVGWTTLDLSSYITGSTPARWAMIKVVIDTNLDGEGNGTSALTLSFRESSASSTFTSVSASEGFLLIPLSSESFQYSIYEAHSEYADNSVSITLLGFLT